MFAWAVRFFVIGIAAATQIGNARAVECHGVFSGAIHYGFSEFYRNTSFGTVGIVLDENPEAKRLSDRIVVPNATVDCLTLRRPRRSIYVLFNHRNSSNEGVGYASFKLYRVIDTSFDIPVLLLERKGRWMRDDSSLKPEPFNSGIMPDQIQAYEKFYKAENTDEALHKFDSAFGKIHGLPDGANPNYMSWRHISLMQPGQLANLQNSKSIDYLMHNMQRFETVEGWLPPGRPVGVTTTKITRGGLLISVFSPMNEGPHRTLLLNFSN